MRTTRRGADIVSKPQTPRLAYELLADAFVAEGLSALFTLMGDGNMHWSTAIASRGVATFHVRDEHNACMMAVGHHSATGEVGVASTTYGPGVTQISTALASAAAAGIPLVVFVGETPLRSGWHNQRIEQQPVVVATGARYLAARSLERLPTVVGEAFHIARQERVPVVLAVPYDLQMMTVDASFDLQSSATLPPRRPTLPYRDEIEGLAQRLRTATRPIVIAGRGVMAAGAGAGVARMARCGGALLATTLPVRGLFDDDPFALGVAGGYTGEPIRSIFAEADLVVAVGASMTNYTVDGGNLFPQAFVVQIDEHPVGRKHGRLVAHEYIRADAKLVVEAVVAELEATGRDTPGFRTPAVAERIAVTDQRQFDIESGALDPRQVVGALDRVLPKDWDIVSGSGHSSYFYAQLKNRRPERFHAIREFGAIGNALGISMGVAASLTDRRVVLIEGDGSLLMHIQEFETIRRHGLPLLICTLNDGAYGSEIHKLRADGVDESQAVFGRPDFASIAQGFGIRGSTVTDLASLDNLVANLANDGEAAVWDFPISVAVTSPRMDRRTAVR